MRRIAPLLVLGMGRRAIVLGPSFLLLTVLVPSTAPTLAAASASEARVFFSADDGSSGWELWKSDGTEAGTVMVKDIWPGEDGSDPELFAVIRGKVFFAADDGVHGREMWVSDGTAEGTRLVRDIVPGSEGSDPEASHWAGGGGAVIGQTLYFTGGNLGDEIWKTDGTRAGTTSLGVEGTCLVGTGRLAFFVHNVTTEVWRTDGTREGTFFLQRLRRPSALFACPEFTEVEGTTLYPGRDVEHGWELWSSDGTVEGTGLVKDMNPGSDSSYPWGLEAVGNRVFFYAEYPYPPFLWASDGTRGGTIRFLRCHHSEPYPTGLLGETLFLSVHAGGLGYELWTSDGTRGGTALFVDINPGEPGSRPGPGTLLRDALFFTADDGMHGFELWRTDGAEAGTYLIKDIDPGAASSGSGPLLVSGGSLFFISRDGVHGYELWTSNGTEVGTVMVEDINPDTSGMEQHIRWLCASPSSRTCYQ